MDFNPADLSLAEGYQFYKSLFAYHPDGVYVLDLQGRFLDCNQATSKISGYSKDELIGHPFAPLIATADLADVMDHFARLIKGEPQNHELKFLHKKGHFIDLGIISMPIVINGHIVAVFGIGRDIGERKRAEAALQESEARTRLIIDTAHDAFVSIDENNRIVDWNRQAEVMFGWPRDEAIGQDLSELIIPPTLRQAHNHGIKRFLERGSSGGMVGKRVEVPALYRDGREFLTQVTITSIRVNGTYVFNAFFHDITLRKLAEEALRQSEERLRTITDNIPALIGYADAKERYQFINKTYEDWFGMPLEKIQGRPMCEVLAEEEYAFAKQYIDKALSGQIATYEQKRGRKRDVQPSYLPHFGEDGKVNGFYILVNDITERKRMEARLLEMAQYDMLTGLPNRRLFYDRFELAMERTKRHQCLLGLIFLDMNRFKEINDTYGHGTGDDVLVCFAQRLKECTRKMDTVARLAGDEFVVIVEDMKMPEAAVTVAEKIKAVMQLPLKLNEDEVPVTTSIGIAIYDGQESADSLIKRADRAMYQAKANNSAAYILAGE
jgi:diguanylate cyclase (GGDEF)-like protein/PAS domain S-box-containing protein